MEFLFVERMIEESVLLKRRLPADCMRFSFNNVSCEVWRSLLEHDQKSRAVHQHDRFKLQHQHTRKEQQHWQKSTFIGIICKEQKHNF